MKFHDVAIGQRFELEGAIYVKSSPMLASPEGGGASRFLARYAQVRLLDGGAAPAKKTEGLLLRMDDALAAFDVFYRDCADELAGGGGEPLPAGRLESLRAAMEARRKVFVAELERQARKP